MRTTVHRFCIAGTQSGAGKTTISLGLMAALRNRGLTVQPFKCGPDYIDAGHHRHAAGRRSRNLDSWMMPKEALQRSFERAIEDADVALCEGVMGLFDGAHPGRLDGSTAEISLWTDTPVVLVVNARAMAGSIAAIVTGFTHFERGITVCGVIANQVGSARHADILREALEAADLPPLLGSLPRDPGFSLPERHLGLVSETETSGTPERIARLASAVEKHVDLERLLSISARVRPPAWRETPEPAPTSLRLGLARDEAFHFYYEDNLDALRDRGVSLVEFSPIHDSGLPDNLDGLYFGGGFPEQFARQLSSNTSFRKSIERFATGRRPIFAECGGYMYLCRSIHMPDQTTWPLAGVLP
ncbi:MAG: cobyrinate a,c-diamide synthase, partial [Puniceicoccales bacterium]